MDNPGAMYADGNGIAQDDVKAVEWFCKAAALDCDAAMNHLGVMYQNGRGVAKDEAKAV